MHQQEKPSNSSYQSLPEIDTNRSSSVNSPEDQKQPSGTKPTSLRDQPPTQGAVVREGGKTYEAFADEYLDQGP